MVPVSDSAGEVDQHPDDSVGFKEHYQCPDSFYNKLRAHVCDYLNTETQWGEDVDLSKIGIRRFTFEDGVISWEATHPTVTHEDELTGELPAEDLEADQDE